ncbi:tetratricopeptide repeat protein [Flavobacterium subsaxonicum]|uniref:Tetratricopeptide repeat protein n=1 Tax=Flavobacterium subsaxonicum WB 4.1-42 = DSM 21790 TaxID=1121898 RepID=A0A0A2MEZ1_9FLAO|nr:tetratricopeptide repeat protein [Flavobacterium subsaxonicum]KGO91227.1 hypothetical protein Q766_18900 [Flavobacterium subsaxonicum WB 4.1-42 = DSM 21790]
MNIKYALVASLLVSMSAFAQKDELKALKKLNEKGAATQTYTPEYKTLLDKAEPLIGSASNDQKADFYFYKAQYAIGEIKKNQTLAPSLLPGAIADYNQVLELEKGGKQNHTKDIKEVILPTIKNMVVGTANTLNQEKKYKEAAPVYALAYEVDKTDGSALYNAAAMAVNGQDYDNALKYYLELDRVGFTGEGTNYSATNKETKAVEYFPNQQTMDLSVKSGAYINPQQEKIPSVKGDIVKNIALIYAQKGEIEKAKQAMANARKANPNDTNLIIAEAELYLKANDMASYKRLIAEASQKSPNDPVLFYNLGVVSAAADPAEAEKYYKRAVELKPDHFDALVNLGVLAIRDEKKIVDEMNKLGNTAKDNQRYEALKKQREGLYTNAIPYLEKAHKVKPNDQYVISVLAGMYQALDKTAEYKAMKAKQTKD